MRPLVNLAGPSRAPTGGPYPTRGRQDIRGVPIGMGDRALGALGPAHQARERR